MIFMVFWSGCGFWSFRYRKKMFRKNINFRKNTWFPSENGPKVAHKWPKMAHIDSENGWRLQIQYFWSKVTIQKCKFRQKMIKCENRQKIFSKTTKHEFNFLSNHHFPSFSSSSAAELQPPRLSLATISYIYTYSEESENFIFHDGSWFSLILFSRFEIENP